jgi:hypothetical protein
LQRLQLFVQRRALAAFLTPSAPGKKQDEHRSRSAQLAHDVLLDNAAERTSSPAAAAGETLNSEKP